MERNFGKDFPDAKKAGAHRLPLLLNPQTGLHVRDNRVAKLATFQQFSAFHQTFKVIGHGLSGDSEAHHLNAETKPKVF